MHYNADLIILDEPTVALAVTEVRKVLDFVAADQGLGPGLRSTSSTTSPTCTRSPTGWSCSTAAHRLRDNAEGHVGGGADRVSHRRSSTRPDEMAQAATPSLIASASRACRSSSSSCCCSALFMYIAPQVFLQPVHLHHLPLDAAAADPARRRPHLRHRRRRDRPLLSRDHRFFRLRLRRALQGVRPRLARRGRRAWLRRVSRRLRQRHLRRAKIGIPSFMATLAHAVLLGRHGDGAVGRQVLRAARRRGELGLAVDRRPAVRRL